MKCRKCKAELTAEARFCHLCGAKQDVTKKPKTRGNGTGSVFKLPNGTWIAIRTVGWSLDEAGEKVKELTTEKHRIKRAALGAAPAVSGEMAVI